jgi:hypothetical protein
MKNKRKTDDLDAKDTARRVQRLVRPRLDPYGCHKQVARWLEAGTYRTLMHRHDGSFIAADESENKMMRADTLPVLADALMNWPQDTEIIPASKWVKVVA